MIIAASLEFEKSHNSAIVERETDNVDIPAVRSYFIYFIKNVFDLPFLY